MAEDVLEPGLYLAEVRVPQQAFSWSFVPGAKPYVGSLTMDRATYEAVGNAGAEEGAAGTTLRVISKMDGFEGGSQLIDLLIKDVQLLEGSGNLTPWEGTWTFADRRWLLHDLTVWGSANITRGINDKGGDNAEVSGAPGKPKSKIPVPSYKEGESEAGGIGGAAPAPQAVGANQRWAYVTYIDWTIGTRNLDADFDGATFGAHPLTALTLLVRVLEAQILSAPKGAQKVCEAIRAAIVEANDGGAADNAYFEDNVRFRGDPLSDVLDSWLLKAELGLGLNPDGTFYVYKLSGGSKEGKTDVDELLDVIKPMLPPVEQGGFFDWPDKRRIRAGSVKVQFPTLWDQRFEAKTPWLDSDLDRKNAYIQNVVRLPQDVTDPADGVAYARGTYMEVGQALRIWSADGTLPINSWSGSSITEARVRELWFPAGRLMMTYGMALFGGGFAASGVWGPRVQAILASYRKTWRINPALMDYVLSWEPMRAAIIDPATGTRLRAYVSADHCIVPKIALPEFKQRRSLAGTNVSAYDEDVKQADGAPAEIQVLDPAQGVFNIEHSAAYLVGGDHVGAVIPGLVDDLPHLGAAGLGLNHGLWQNAKLRAQYKAFVIMAVVWGADPQTLGFARHFNNQRSVLTYSVEIKPKDVGYTGAVNSTLRAEIVDASEPARFKWGTVAEARSAKEPPKPANYEQVSALAHAKARTYYFSRRSRLTGVYTVPGWSSNYRLFGPMKSLTFSIAQQGRITTTFDVTTPPFVRDEWHLLPETVRRALYRFTPETAHQIKRPGS